MKILITSLCLFWALVGCKSLFAGDYTSARKGLAIEVMETSTSINTYNSKISALNQLIAPVMENATFFKLVNGYDQLKQVEEQKKYAKQILKLIDTDVFENNNILPQRTNLFSDALTRDPNTQKYSFDCDTSSFVYLDVFELTFGNFIPVVLLDCPGHAIIRWKFSDSTYINWETTVGEESLKEEQTYYEDNCEEIITGSNAFYALFYFNIAFTKDELEDYAGAIADYSKAIELNPKYTDAFCNRGSAKSELKDYTGAIADYSKAIELNPKDAATFYNRGYVKDELEDYAGAIADYNKAIELNPKYTDAFYNRGYVKDKLKNYAGAIADYSKYIELNPKDADAFYNRGSAKSELKDYTGAIADFSKAIELDPKLAVAYRSREIVRQRLKEQR